MIVAAVVAAPAHASPVLHVGPEGAVVREDPYLPSRAATDLAPPPRGHRAAARARPAAKTTVRRAIAEAFEAGEITVDERDEFRAAYGRALRTRASLPDDPPSERWLEMNAQIETLEAIAGRDQLTGSRMPALFLQLQRNTQYWPSRRFPLHGQRIVFSGSELTFQYYAGHGLQIQPLANFGKANALWRSGKKNRLRALLDELVSIASRRGRFTTWEYWFEFGGLPPWTSAMSQGTAIQALARASELLEEPSYRRIARSGIRAFSTRYPVGVRAPGRDGGNHYLIYSFSPGLRVLNAFTQTLNGLYDYGAISGQARALELFEKGQRSLQAELPDYDTGAWTLYSLGGAEATLEYHQLAADFLGNLCERTGTPLWCDTVPRLEGYVTESPRLELLTTRLVEGRSQNVRFALSKRSTIRITISREGSVVYSDTAAVPYGTRSFAWTPPEPGEYVVTLSAESFADTLGSASGTIEVRPKS